MSALMVLAAAVPASLAAIVGFSLRFVRQMDLDLTKEERDTEEREKARRREEEKRASAGRRAEIVKAQIAKIPSEMASAIERIDCPVCRRDQGIYDGKEVKRIGASYGSFVWGQYIDALLSGNDVSSALTAIVRKTDGGWYCGPSGVFAVEHEDRRLMVQLCISCGAIWKVVGDAKGESA